MINIFIGIGIIIVYIITLISISIVSIKVFNHNQIANSTTGIEDLNQVLDN